MELNPEIKAEIHSQDAVDATAAAQEAVEKARMTQIKAALVEHGNDLTSQFSQALREVFGEGDDDAAVLIHRVPLICKEICSINEILQHRTILIEQIRSDLIWMRWIGSGFVLAAGLLALKALGV